MLLARGARSLLWWVWFEESLLLLERGEVQECRLWEREGGEGEGGEGEGGEGEVAALALSSAREQASLRRLEGTHRV